MGKQSQTHTCDSMASFAGSMDNVMQRLRERAHTPNALAASAPSAVALLDEERERRQRIRALAEEMGERYWPAKVKIDQLEIYHQSQKAVVKQIQEFAEKIEENIHAGRGLVLLGTVGTGKDHLLAHLLFAAANIGASVKFVNGQEVFGNFRDRMDTGQADESYFAELVRPKVLGISDPTPPAGQLSAWDCGNLYRLLDRRYRHCRPTWVTLNARTIQEADEKLTAQIFDRLRDGSLLLTCCWPSYRERTPARKAIA